MTGNGLGYGPTPTRGLSDPIILEDDLHSKHGSSSPLRQAMRAH